MRTLHHCSVEGCDRFGRTVKGLCLSHYKRVQRGRASTGPLRPVSDAARAKMAAATTARWQDPAYRAKVVEAQRVGQLAAHARRRAEMSR